MAHEQDANTAMSHVKVTCFVDLSTQPDPLEVLQRYNIKLVDILVKYIYT